MQLHARRTWESLTALVTLTVFPHQPTHRLISNTPHAHYVLFHAFSDQTAAVTPHRTQVHQQRCELLQNKRQPTIGIPPTHKRNLNPAAFTPDSHHEYSS